MLQENTQKHSEFKDEVRKNSWDTNVILDELRPLMIKHVVEKGKEVGSYSEGGNKASQSVSENDKEMSMNQNQITPACDKGIPGSQPVFPFINPLSNDVTQMLPKSWSFEGKEPKAWLRKLVKYFKIYRVPMGQRVQLASLFLRDKVDAWFHNWNKGREPNWDKYERGVYSRFGDEGLEDTVEGFMKLI